MKYRGIKRFSLLLSFLNLREVPGTWALSFLWIRDTYVHCLPAFQSMYSGHSMKEVGEVF